MQNKSKKKRATGLRLAMKSALWTLIALSLIAIGYFGADLLLG